MKKWLMIGALVAVLGLVSAILAWQPWAARPNDAQPSATGDGWTATANFPSEPDLKVKVSASAPDEKQNAALPAATTLTALAEYRVDEGEFPSTGAQVSFAFDEQLSTDRIPVVVHWNEVAELWEPVETSLSEDRRTVTAPVSHFSSYGVVDYLFNALGQITGNAATSGVTCDQPIPDWADPQYFEDINSPVLWCGGRDANNADLLVAKVKMNRDTAAKVTVAIDHAWAHSDLWKTSPTDLATMAAAAELPANPFSKRQYLIQPFGEMDFGFSRDALEKLYYGGTNQPLIQVETGWFYTAAAIMWGQIGEMSGGESPIAALSSTMAMIDCGHGLLTAGSKEGAVDAFGQALTCLGTQQSKDLLTRGVRTVLADRYPHLTSGWITVHSKKILSKFGLIGLGLKTADFSLKVFSAIGDAGLPDSVRRFVYEPSLEAIKERLPQKKAYAGTQLGTNYSFSYPAGWKAVEEKKDKVSADVAVYDAKGVEVASLSLLTSWDASGAAQPRPVFKSSDTQSQGTMSAMGMGLGAKPGPTKFLVRTVIMDLTSSKDEATAYGWDKPVAVAVSAGGWQAPATELMPFVLYGVGGISASNTVTGQKYVPVIFSTTRYFDNVQQAEAWTSTPEHNTVIAMIASFNG